MKNLFKVHFSDSRMTDESGSGQRQPNLDVQTYKMNKRPWNLPWSEMNQSKIR
jgi:hypothetical protein